MVPFWPDPPAPLTVFGGRPSVKTRNSTASEFRYGVARAIFRLTAFRLRRRRVSGARRELPAQRRQKPVDPIAGAVVAKSVARGAIVALGVAGVTPKPGFRVAQEKGDSPWTRAHSTSWAPRSPRS